MIIHPNREFGPGVLGFGPLNGFGFGGRQRERAQLLGPDTAGIRERVPLVAQTIAKQKVRDRVVSAMTGQEEQFQRDTAHDIVGGEQGRILGLGRAYWPFFYGLPLALLDRSHHHVKKVFEKGPSLDAHLGALDPKLQPTRSEAVDFPHIARGATEFVDVMKREGLLRRFGTYNVRAEGETPASYHADLSISILEAQYDNWQVLARQLFTHSDTVLVGDVLHGRTALQVPVQAGDTVKFSPATEPDRTTGFQLELLNEVGAYSLPNQADFGYQRRYYTYRIKTDPAIIGDGSAVKYVNSGASQEGVCTVFVDPKTGKESMQAWTFRPTEGAPAQELRKVFAAEETLHDLYEHTPGWDGNGALGVLGEIPSAAAERRNAIVDTAVVTMVPDATQMSGRLPLTILARNKEQLLDRAEQGQLRHIGEGKEYATVDDFLTMVHTLMDVSSSGRPHIDEITTFDPPPLLDIIASRKPGVIRDILKTARQTR